ncbi:hypothetical protein KAU19_05950 [Candidatus Parcubacteria bacterium]|nr:hypothetical protein [Candidatus Parcubacteria bacterium]
MGDLIDKIKLEAKKQAKQLKEKELLEKMDSIIQDFQEIAAILKSNHLTNCSIRPQGNLLVDYIFIDSNDCVVLKWGPDEEESFSELADLSYRLTELDKQGSNIVNEIYYILSDENCSFDIN